MPEVHERAAKFLTASSFLCAKLTGRFTVDRYLAEDFLPYTTATLGGLMLGNVLVSAGLTR